VTALAYHSPRTSATCAAGAHIIVDDVFYFVETPFEGPGPAVVSTTSGEVVTGP
jgi:hypothetical protein